MGSVREISFSICIPNFNYGGYIGRTIDSVLNQDYQNFEIIIVDNASTDNSWEVISSYAKKDSRIKVYRNEYNVGFAPNLDRVAQKASFDFIIMLSSDDLMHANALAEYAAILNELGDRAENFILTSAINVIDQDDKLIGRQFKDEYHNVAASTLWPALSADAATIHDGLAIFKEVFPRMGTAGPFCATLFSKRLYQAVSGYGSINLIGPDAHFVFKMLLLGTPVVFVNRTLFAYRIHSSSQLGQVNSNLNINILLDRYIFTNLYSDTQLSKAGVQKADVIKFIIDETCFNSALREVRNGRYMYAFRHFCFAFAAYPGTAIRNYKTFLLPFVLAIAPISRLVLTWLKKDKN